MRFYLNRNEKSIMCKVHCSYIYTTQLTRYTHTHTIPYIMQTKKQKKKKRISLFTICRAIAVYEFFYFVLSRGAEFYRHNKPRGGVSGIQKHHPKHKNFPNSFEIYILMLNKDKCAYRPYRCADSWPTSCFGPGVTIAGCELIT